MSQQQAQQVQQAQQAQQAERTQLLALGQGEWNHGGSHHHQPPVSLLLSAAALALADALVCTQRERMGGKEGLNQCLRWVEQASAAQWHRDTMARRRRGMHRLARRLRRLGCPQGRPASRSGLTSMLFRDFVETKRTGRLSMGQNTSKSRA